MRLRTANRHRAKARRRAVYEAAAREYAHRLARLLPGRVDKLYARLNRYVTTPQTRRP